MGRSYRSVNADVAASKTKHPELFCPVDRCLWRTGGGRCPRHPDPSLPDTRPRATYLYPNSDVTIEMVFPHGTEPPQATTHRLFNGKVITVSRVGGAQGAFCACEGTGAVARDGGFDACPAGCEGSVR